MGQVYDVVVIGATIAGLTSAVALADAGVQVVVIDPNPPGESAAVGAGIATLAQGEALGHIKEFGGEEALAQHVDANLRGHDFIARVCEDAHLPFTRTRAREAVLSANRLDALWDEATTLSHHGLEPRPTKRQRLAGLVLKPAWELEDALLVDPVDYAEALTERARQAGAVVRHDIAITRFRRHPGLHAVLYRSQLAWNTSMLATWAPAVVDTMAVSPWGRHAAGLPLMAPVVEARGLRIAAPLMVRDSPARIIRPYRGGVLVVGHPVPLAAIETAKVGLRQWVSEELKTRVHVVASFGATSLTHEPRAFGTSPIPGGHWASGFDLWELSWGSATGLRLADLLLSGKQSLPLISRARAGVTKGVQRLFRKV